MTPGGDDWTEVELGQLGSVVTGRTPPKAEPELFGVEYPFFTPSDMSYGDRSPPTERFISEAGAIRFRRIRLPVGSTCFVCIGATIGKVCLTSQPSFTNQQLNSIIPEEAHHDPRFVYYLLVSVAEEIKALASGAATPIINKSSFSAFKVKVPPLPTQQRIAAILSAYDDLIENNTRRIALLEEMARRLYDEWFVHFRFPGHEEVEFVEQDGQRIPKGWVPVYLYDVAEVTYGYPFKSKQFNAVEEGLGVIRIRDVMADRASAFTLEEGKPHHRVADGDILIGMDGAFYLGRWAGGSAWLNQRVARLRPKAPMSRHLLFQSVAQPIKRLEETIVGTTVAHLSARDLKEMSLVLPDRDRLELAARHLEPVFDQLLILKRKNSNLRAQRDLLLPKLVSGEIDVSHAEATLEAAE